MECSDESNIVDGYLQGKDAFEFNYVATPRGAGSAILPGVTLRFGDLQGMFLIQRFFPVRQSFRVLPTCIDVDTTHPTTKQVNSLPPP